MNTPMTKICSNCKVEKSLEEFYKSKDQLYGRKSQCKSCAYKYKVDNNYTSGKTAVRLFENETTKYCYMCKRYKNLSEFYNSSNPGYSKGKKIYCKSCSDHDNRQRVITKNRDERIKVSEWEDIKVLYKYTCLSCGKKEPEISLTRDHIKPLSKGGLNIISNIQPLCMQCNVRKHTKEIDYR